MFYWKHTKLKANIRLIAAFTEKHRHHKHLEVTHLYRKFTLNMAGLPLSVYTGFLTLFVLYPWSSVSNGDTAKTAYSGPTGRTEALGINMSIRHDICSLCIMLCIMVIKEKQHSIWITSSWNDDENLSSLLFLVWLNSTEVLKTFHVDATQRSYTGSLERMAIGAWAYPSYQW